MMDAPQHHPLPRPPRPPCLPPHHPVPNEDIIIEIIGPLIKS